MTAKTRQEVEALKRSWVKDPCWDIEDSAGFEEYYEELKAWRKKYECEQETAMDAKREARRERVMNMTGIGNAAPDILDALCTWSEIERAVESQDGYIGDFATREAIVMAELAGAQIRATLLLAAQVKRIADALERMDDGDSLVRSAEIWGSGK